MIRLRSFSLIIFITFISFGAYAQFNRIFIPDVELSGGSEAMLSVYMDNVDEITAVELTFAMPYGISIVPGSATLTERAVDHLITANTVGGYYKIVILSPTNSLIEGIAGELFSVRVKATYSLEDNGDYPMNIRDAVMSKTDGQNVLQQVESGKFVIKSFPNLHVVSLDCSEPVAGQPFTVTWRVRNDGEGSTGENPWNDCLWLVPSISGGTSMTGSILLKSFDNLTSLDSGDYYENTANITLDQYIYGDYDLVLTSNIYGINDVDFSMTGGRPPYPYDPDHADYGFLMATTDDRSASFKEENETAGRSDNFFYKHIYVQVPPLADIQVPSVVAVVYNDGDDQIPSPVNSAGLASSSVFYSGKNVKVTATITNNGDAGIDHKYISNVLYISDTPNMTGSRFARLASHNMYLTAKPGEAVTDDFYATIPYEWYGDTYFIVDADVYDKVYELANNSNNRGASNLINTLLTPGADFEPIDLVVPDQVSPGMPFEIKYSVVNVGPGDPFSNSWMDKIYISAKNTGLDDSAILIDSLIQIGGYELSSDGYRYSGDSYKVTRTEDLKELAVGTYYLYVCVDVEDRVFEHEGEANNVIMSKPVVVDMPDLSVEIVSVSGDTLTTGEKVAVGWKLKNYGAVDIQSVPINDVFYVSRDSNGNDARSLGMVTNTVSIPAGGEKTLHANITIPKNSSLNGTKYLFMRTNIDNSLIEGNKSNNISNFLEKQFVYYSAPEEAKVNGYNLTVYDMKLLSSAVSGEGLRLSYKVKNTGSLSIDKEVKQTIFFSSDSVFDSSDKAVSVSGLQPVLYGLNPNEFVIADVGITVPADLKGGSNYILVVVNQDKVVPEKIYEDNQVMSPVYVDGNLPNLIITDLVVPESVMTSEKVQISCSIANNGDWMSNPVSCRIYLSNDHNYSADDRMLTSVRIPQLSPGASQSLESTIVLPDNQFGTRYLIAKIDNLMEESSYSDNVRYSVFTSVQSALPDLSIVDLTSEGVWRAGSTVTVKAKVKNIGDDAVHADKWVDAFYLNQSYSFDTSTAIKLFNKTHVGILSKDGSYEISAVFDLPNDLNGYYALFAATDDTDVLTEIGKDNNRNSTTVFVEKQEPTDLVIDRISAPVSILAGESVSISYDIHNNSEYTAKGSLRDIIYMSKDARWDENDVMVGVASGDVEIDPGMTLTRNITGRITNLTEGRYHLIVRTNSTHSIVEKDYTNNQTVETTATNLEFANLSLGGSAIVNTSGLFKLPLHSGFNGKTIGLSLSYPDDKSAGLYASYESVPSIARHDFSASDIKVTRQDVLIPKVQEGNYYILAQDNTAISRTLNEFVIDGEQELSETKMALSAREMQFEAVALSNPEGGTDGWISTEISGALFDSIMDFRLANDNKKILAEKIHFINSTSSIVTFNLKEAEIGNYDVVSELPDGTQSILPNSFRVIQGQSGNLTIRLMLPTSAREDSYTPISLSYSNESNTDISIKELLVFTTNAYISETIEGLGDCNTVMRIVPDYPEDGNGMVSISPKAHAVVNCVVRLVDDCTVAVYIVK